MALPIRPSMSADSPELLASSLAELTIADENISLENEAPVLALPSCEAVLERFLPLLSAIRRASESIRVDSTLVEQVLLRENGDISKVSLREQVLEARSAGLPLCCSGDGDHPSQVWFSVGDEWVRSGRGGDTADSMIDFSTNMLSCQLKGVCQAVGKASAFDKQSLEQCCRPTKELDEPVCSSVDVKLSDNVSSSSSSTTSIAPSYMLHNDSTLLGMHVRKATCALYSKLPLLRGGNDWQLLPLLQVFVDHIYRKNSKVVSFPHLGAKLLQIEPDLYVEMGRHRRLTRFINSAVTQGFPVKVVELPGKQPQVLLHQIVSALARYERLSGL